MMKNEVHIPQAKVSARRRPIWMATASSPRGDDPPLLKGPLEERELSGTAVIVAASAPFDSEGCTQLFTTTLSDPFCRRGQPRTFVQYFGLVSETNKEH
jgi:hypothetical protein